MSDLGWKADLGLKEFAIARCAMHKPWVFWLKGNRSINIHRSRECHRLSMTLGPLCLRWDW